LIQIKVGGGRRVDAAAMARPTFFQCPNTHLGAQAVMLAAPDPAQPVQVEAVTCSSCRRVHLVDVKTGKLLLQPMPAEPVVRFGIQ
jgi:hypothetical protein